jgi:putative flippase GtrA
VKHRIPAFLTVGVIGFVLQLTSLAWMTMVVGWPYGPATAVAVQLAVLHNFLWHERWTWRDRTVTGSGMIRRLARYEVTTGLTSIAGNVLGTLIFVETMHLPVLAANVAAVITMSAANFVLADRWVFAGRALGLAAAFAASSTPVMAGDLRSETVKAWDQYIARAEATMTQRRPVTNRSNDEPRGNAISVSGGRIHHWTGSVLIRNTTVGAVVDGLMMPGTPPPQDDVLESRVLERGNDRLRVYLKLVRKTLVTVTYDTEHDVVFMRRGPGLATSRSVATRIAEVDGRDRGFLWRLNSYWRYVQVGNDVLVELESISLSRDVPSVLKPIAGPIINRIARESVVDTLAALRAHFEGGGAVSRG